MSKAVWKYVLEGDRTPLEVPKGAKFLSVGMQGPTLTAWALVDTASQENELRVLHVYGTGHEIPVDSLSLRFLGRVEQDGYFVWHVFEEWT